MSRVVTLGLYIKIDL